MSRPRAGCDEPCRFEGAWGLGASGLLSDFRWCLATLVLGRVSSRRWYVPEKGLRKEGLTANGLEHGSSQTGTTTIINRKVVPRSAWGDKS